MPVENLKQEYGKHFQTQFHRSICFAQVVFQSIQSTNSPCSLGLNTIPILIYGSYFLPWTTLHFLVLVWLQYCVAILSQVLKCTNVYMSMHLCDGEKQLIETLTGHSKAFCVTTYSFFQVLAIAKCIVVQRARLDYLKTFAALQQ